MANSAKDCFLTEKKCNVPTDLRNPACFVSIPFHLSAELELIKDTLASLGIKPLIADKKPPQFLFHDVCDKLSKAVFGIFEVTETNENVFMEYGMMVEQGKPAILLYDKNRRKHELGSNMKGILQTRYANLPEIIPKLVETISTIPARRPPPEGSILMIPLELHEVVQKMKGVVVGKGYHIQSCKLHLNYVGETNELMQYEGSIYFGIKKNGENHEFCTNPKVFAWKEKVGIGLYELRGVFWIGGKVRAGQKLSKKKQEIALELTDIIIRTFTSFDNT